MEHNYPGVLNCRIKKKSRSFACENIKSEKFQPISFFTILIFYNVPTSGFVPILSGVPKICPFLQIASRSFYLYDEWCDILRVTDAQGVGRQALLVYQHHLRRVGSWSWFHRGIWRSRVRDSLYGVRLYSVKLYTELIYILYRVNLFFIWSS